MLQIRYALLFFVILCAVTESGCGSKDSQPQQPTILGSLSATERARYCFINVSPEPDAQVVQSLISTLTGSWQHYPVALNDGRRTFNYDPVRSVATVSDYQEFGGFTTISNIRDIVFKKVCVSKVLDASFGAYAGYRLLELMSAGTDPAAGGDGGVAMAAKFVTVSGTPELYLSDYYYNQHAATDATFTDPSEVLDPTGQIQKIWVYPVHSP